MLDLNSKGVSRNITNVVADIIRSEFVNIGNFTVVERSQMKAIMEEQGLQMTGCTDSSCAVQFGKLLSARRIVVGKVSKAGRKKIIITARYVDVEKGQSLFSARVMAKGIDDISDAAKKLADKLAERIVTGDKEVIIPKTAGGFYTRSIVPGWGQFYAGESIKGVVFLSAFILGAGLTGYSAYNYTLAQSEYDSIEREDTLDTINKRRDDLTAAALYINVSVGILAGVYVIHWLDALIFSKASLDAQLAVNDSRQ